MTCVEQDSLGQAFEDAFEVLTQHSVGEMQYPPEHRNYMAIVNPYPYLRGNANYCGMLPPEEPLYDWRGVTNGSADLCLEGSRHQSLQNIADSQLAQVPFFQQKGGRGSPGQPGTPRVDKAIFKFAILPQHPEC